MTQVNSILQLKSVSRQFVTSGVEVDVLNNINMHIKKGSFAMITGSSGSGKSTLLNILALLDQASSGEVLFDDVAVSGYSDNQLCKLRKTKIGMVFQGFHLLPRRSVLENILFRFRYLNTKKSIARADAIKAAATVGLESIINRPAHLLSGGEMQRVSIARAIALRPDLLVADEPTGNLDSAATDNIMQHFTDLNRHGITTLMVTHDRSLLNWASEHFECRDGSISPA